MELIKKYFPNLEAKKIEKLEALGKLYPEWNEKINVISRKDIRELYVRHILHSLALPKLFNFAPGTQIMDVGTGGGFPGIPMAILLPEVNFYLVDSIGKKIKVVQEIVNELELKNVCAEQKRVELIKEKFDFIVSRAVTAFPRFVSLVEKNISHNQKNSMLNGVIYLKGGDFNEEVKPFKNKIEVFEISDLFEEPFFETKKVIYLPL